MITLFYKNIALKFLTPIQSDRSKKNKADRHKSRAPSLQRQTDQPTDRQTDRPTDRVVYRVACTRLKIKCCRISKKMKTLSDLSL